MSGLWVFGYGSLVSPESFGRTLGRALRPGIDFFRAELAGYGRRWNYGVMHSQGVLGADRYTIVALGIVASEHESVNGVVGWVEEDELIELDRRERHYDRVDVTGLTTVDGDHEEAASIVVYVPRAEAITHYEQARDAGWAAVEQRYWNLVDDAFEALGPDQHARYVGSTPRPDVPILALERE